MCCITFPALEVMMTTTELTTCANQQGRTPWLPQTAKPQVHMNWVVVTDKSENPRLRMSWATVIRDD